MFSALSVAAAAALVVTLDVESPEVTVGEPVVAKVTVKNEGDKAATCPALILDEDAVRFLLGSGADQFIYQHKGEKGVEDQLLEPGKEASATFEIPTWAAGSLGIEAQVRDAKPSAAGASGTVTVKPGPKGEKETGVKLETSHGPITMKLLPEAAPNTAVHFLARVREGFYDGLTFHRIIPGFMMQGGDPQGNGQGGPGYTLPAEFSKDPAFKHVPGRVAMARTPDPDSAGSQFYICFGSPAQLDGAYTVFGEVTDGMDAVKKVENVGSRSGKPTEQVTITKASVVLLK